MMAIVRLFERMIWSTVAGMGASILFTATKYTFSQSRKYIIERCLIKQKIRSRQQNMGYETEQQPILYLYWLVKWQCRALG
jgi:hypothetical protein